MLTDLRLALRQLAQAPRFTAIVVLILALAIGASTAVYSALDSIILNPFDDPGANRNVGLRAAKLPDRTEAPMSFPDFEDVAARATSFEFLAATQGGYSNLTGTSEPRRVRRDVVTSRYFDINGIKMALGRAFLPAEFVSGNVVVVSHGFWQGALGGAPDVLGRSLLIDDVPHTVVGVTSESFQKTGNFIDVWTPRLPEAGAAQAADPRGIRNTLIVMARLRPGVSRRQAQAELDIIAASLAEQHPTTNANMGILVTDPLATMQVLGPMVRTMFGAVAGLLLIACANVANLCLLRANARQREMSIQSALGASRGRLVRQLLTQNIVLAAVGGGLGLLLAYGALFYIRTSIPGGTMNLVASGLSRITTISIDGRVLGFAVVLTLLTGVLSGLIPAWLASTSNLNETLNQGSRGSTEGKSRGRIRRALVVLEIALSLALLACSGLLVRSYLRLSRYDPGFDPQHAALARLQTRGRNYATAEQQNTFTNALLARLREIPGVEAAGATSFFPLAGTFGTQAIINVEGTTLTEVAARPTAFSYIVSPEYFRAMGIRLVTGRFFAESDDAAHTRVAIINETLARRHFAGTDPIGKRINIGSGRETWRQIVGVVADVGQAYVGEPPPSQIYEAMPQVPQNRLYLMVRTSGDPASVLPLIKSQAALVDPSIPLGDLITVDSFYHNKFTSQRLTLQLLMAFAAIALVIAAVGIYGVIAFSVSQRTVEFGIRMALGASRGDVLRLVLAEGVLLVGLGLLIGVATTLVAGQAMEAALYETSGRDPAAIVLITAGFTLIAFVACWVPARKATKVDPLIALRAG